MTWVLGKLENEDMTRN